MKFKIGDMVRIVAPPEGASTGELPHVGLSGTITDSLGTYTDDGVPYWGVTVADGRGFWVTTRCLRLIPGDPSGRQLVRWDQCEWRPNRVLTAPKQPAEESHVSGVRLCAGELVQRVLAVLT